MTAARPDPEALLAAARDAEIGLRLTARTAALEELDVLLHRAAEDTGGTESPGYGDSRPGGELGRDRVRQLELAVEAERALDLARLLKLQPARAMAEQVIARAGPGDEIAVARATEAVGRALAWEGTEGATRGAETVLLRAADQYGALGLPDWHGNVLVWLGYTVFFQNGALPAAEKYMSEGLQILPRTSRRRAVLLTFLADVLITRGAWSALEPVLAEAGELAGDSNHPMARAYVAWSRARVASARGDAPATERYLLETERDAHDWFDIHTGSTFLADAAEMLDRVGQSAGADAYLARAIAREPDDEFVRQAKAALLARRGDPDTALVALQELSRGDWLEKRLIWRHTLLSAYASLRAGRIEAGQLAARALEQAVAAGGVEIAVSGEPVILGAVLPLAEAAGSRHARALLAPDNGLIVRLFGVTSMFRGSQVLALPPGQAAELARMLAAHPHGLNVDEVLEAFFPDGDPTTGRHRLRQMLTRLRSGAGDIVTRDGDQLRLVPAWVDVHAFVQACDRALKAPTELAAGLAYAALALRTGPPLPADPYAGWATALRRQLRRRYLDVLDLLAADASRRHSLDEALLALTLAREEDPYDESRYVTAAQHLISLGRTGAARRLAREAADVLAEISVSPPPALRALM